MSDNGEQEFEELLKQITHGKKRAFLEKYPSICVSSQTCEALGIGESTIRAWRRDDEVFNSAFSALKKEIDNDRLQKYEAELDKRVLTTPSKQSDILLMFGLKAFHPDKYREKVTTTPLIGNVTIQMDIPRPWKLPQADIVDVTPTEKSTELPE